MEIDLPELCLVVLIGASGCGKSTFARAHFKATEVVSSDACRAMVSDDENNQAATRDAFEVLHLIATKRLAAGRLTVIDATNVQPASRAPLLALAREQHVQPVALVFDLPEALCAERNRLRENRSLGQEIIHRQVEQLHRGLASLEQEGFAQVIVFSTPEEVASAHIRRQRLKNNRRWDAGPFDIIGDVHGCCTELERLLAELGYQAAEMEGPERPAGTYFQVYAHPAGRSAVFIGDLVDRGPRIADALQLVRNMVQAKTGLCVLGNHDDKLLRELCGRSVKVSHGLEKTLAELDRLPAEIQPAFRQELIDFLGSLPSHYVLDHGKLVVTHAGIRRSMIGRETEQVREFTLYGKTTGEVDELGLPVRLDWAGRYRGRAVIVYGHTAVQRPEWVNRTIDIDTGCVFGNRLTALRYPEQELVSVPAEQVYWERSRPLQGAGEDDPSGEGDGPG